MARPALVWGTALITAGLVSALLGLVTGNRALLMPGFGLLLVGGVALWRGGRGSSDDQQRFADIGSDAEALDAYLERTLGELPQPLVARLASIKVLLVQVIGHIADRERSRSVPAEDQFFTRELMRRYLPDACDAYLAVVRATREVSLAPDDGSPEASFLAQADVLEGRLKSILARVATGEMERLSRHEAFIATKR